jgi:tryptophan synthase alpha chain
MISNAFKKGSAFIGYFTAGDGGFDYNLEVALALEKGGVDLLEIGIPFSDPVADGPTIQKAMKRSLQNGTTILQVLQFIEKLRKYSDIPIVLMSYYNPILNMGPCFIERVKQCGANGVLIVDLPFDEQFHQIKEIDQVLLVSPSTTEERIQEIAEHSKGFIYFAIQKGTTGVRDSLPQGIQNQVKLIKKYTSLPVALGFGISNRQSAEEALRIADGFVIGSLFVQAMEDKASPESFIKLAQYLDPRRSL